MAPSTQLAGLEILKITMKPNAAGVSLPKLALFFVVLIEQKQHRLVFPLLSQRIATHHILDLES